MANLIELSILAHTRAAKYGLTVPAAREDLRSYPMVWARGVPVFDELRLRDDQYTDLHAVLSRLSGSVRASNVQERVQDWMEAYGAQGLRQADVQEGTGATKPAVLKALRKLVADGRVSVKEEKNPRGGNASPRKRYFWVGALIGTANLSQMDTLDGDLHPVSADRLSNGTVGIIHHGSATGMLQGCRCGRCRWALEEGYFGEMVSKARMAGGSGFAEGLALATLRRKAWERAND
jgi:hypothetical protein